MAEEAVTKYKGIYKLFNGQKQIKCCRMVMVVTRVSNFTASCINYSDILELVYSGKYPYWTVNAFIAFLNNESTVFLVPLFGLKDAFDFPRDPNEICSWKYQYESTP